MRIHRATAVVLLHVSLAGLVWSADEPSTVSSIGEEVPKQVRSSVINDQEATPKVRILLKMDDEQEAPPEARVPLKEDVKHSEECEGDNCHKSKLHTESSKACDSQVPSQDMNDEKTKYTKPKNLVLETGDEEHGEKTKYAEPKDMAPEMGVKEQVQVEVPQKDSQFSVSGDLIRRSMQGLEDMLDQVEKSSVKVLEKLGGVMDQVGLSREQMMKSLDTVMDRVSESVSKSKVHVIKSFDSVMDQVSASKTKMMEEIDNVIDKVAHSKVIEEIRALPGEIRESFVLSVRNRSYVAAGVMVAITTAVLVAGAVYYAWCHQDAWSYHRSYSAEEHSHMGTSDADAYAAAAAAAAAVSNIPGPGEMIFANGHALAEQEDGGKVKGEPASPGGSKHEESIETAPDDNKIVNSMGPDVDHAQQPCLTHDSHFGQDHNDIGHPGGDEHHSDVARTSDNQVMCDESDQQKLELCDEDVSQEISEIVDASSLTELTSSAAFDSKVSELSPSEISVLDPAFENDELTQATTSIEELQENVRTVKNLSPGLYNAGNVLGKGDDEMQNTEVPSVDSVKLGVDGSRGEGTLVCNDGSRKLDIAGTILTPGESQID